ncbi:hypothetical protein HDV05_002406 [Chytridiales sp. JEL 0842]|nr:hypothetical protein HDV05_002406 [Chytridiales sp. JEL 0842]
MDTGATGGGISATISGMVGTCCQVAKDVASFWGQKLSRKLLVQHDPQAYYKHLMSVATNYEQWAAAGLALDRLQDNEKWKADPASEDYDHGLLQDRLKQLKVARESGDLASMIFLLRTSLSRNLGDMGNPKLYTKSYVGTKHLIEDYINEVTMQLNMICDTDSPEISLEAKFDFFTNTQRAFGRTALLLSGGAVFGLTHVGVVKTLYEAKMLPKIINGSSVGSIVAAVICTKTDEELPPIFNEGGKNLCLLSEIGIKGSLLYRVKAILVQKYYGDITIVPSIAVKDYTEIVTNPDNEMMAYYTTVGERATWPQVSIMKNHCQIEMCIDEILYRLRVRKLEGHMQQQQAQPQSSGQRKIRPGFGLTKINGEESSGRKERHPSLF